MRSSGGLSCIKWAFGFHVPQNVFRIVQQKLCAVKPVIWGTTLLHLIACKNESVFCFSYTPAWQVKGQVYLYLYNASPKSAEWLGYELIGWKPCIDIVSGKVNRFCSSSKRPDQLQGLGSHLFNWYYRLSGGDQSGRKCDRWPPRRVSGAMLPHMASSRAPGQFCSTSSPF